jgi:hypothetical protein
MQEIQHLPCTGAPMCLTWRPGRHVVGHAVPRHQLQQGVNGTKRIVVKLQHLHVWCTTCLTWRLRQACSEPSSAHISGSKVSDLFPCSK